MLTYNNNGPIMHNPITVHLVWYGEFEEQFKTTVRTFVRSISNRTDPANTRMCLPLFRFIPAPIRLLDRLTASSAINLRASGIS